MGDPNSTINGPSSASQFRWHAGDGPTLNAGLVLVIFQGIWSRFAQKPYNFVIFQGGGGGRGVPHLDPHMQATITIASSPSFFG